MSLSTSFMKYVLGFLYVLFFSIANQDIDVRADVCRTRNETLHACILQLVFSSFILSLDALHTKPNVSFTHSCSVKKLGNKPYTKYRVWTTDILSLLTACRTSLNLFRNLQLLSYLRNVSN